MHRGLVMLSLGEIENCGVSMQRCWVMLSLGKMRYIDAEVAGDADF